MEPAYLFFILFFVCFVGFMYCVLCQMSSHRDLQMNILQVILLVKKQKHTKNSAIRVDGFDGKMYVAKWQLLFCIGG